MGAARIYPTVLLPLASLAGGIFLPMLLRKLVIELR
jgi:hypothetical protein